MNKLHSIKLVVACWLMVIAIGCNYPTNVASELGSIKLVEEDAFSSVGIQRCSIQKEKERAGFVVSGYVVRKSGKVTVTSRTRLHFRFIDAQGNMVREEITDFQPEEIRDWTGRGASHPYARFAASFKEVPSGTAEIEVLAQDDGRSPH